MKISGEYLPVGKRNQEFIHLGYFQPGIRAETFLHGGSHSGTLLYGPVRRVVYMNCF